MPNNRLIFKNSLFLYGRLLLSLFISFYISRVVLNVLGVVDYGIYNVVGGVITLLTFLNNSLVDGTQRFLTFEIGRNNIRRTKYTFNIFFNLHLLIATAILLIALGVGFWFINTQLVIPADRLTAANYVFLFSTLSYCLSIINAPHVAVIIAHERMGIYAFMGIADVALKLGAALMLPVIAYDKLIVYAFLIFMATVVINISYYIICHIKFRHICIYGKAWSRILIKEIASFSGWNLLGSFASVMVSQGGNIILNIFFGPVVNAARGIAYQVMGAIRNFSSSFQMSMNPQIVKNYAQDQIGDMVSLVLRGSKFSYFIFFIIFIPVFYTMPYVLKIWLSNVPEYAILFCRLILINALLESLTYNVTTAIRATGKLKVYQLIGSIIMLIELPLAFILFKLGKMPEIIFYINIAATFILTVFRFAYFKSKFGIAVPVLLKKIVYPVLSVSVITIAVSFAVNTVLHTDNFLKFMLLIAIFVFSTSAIIYTIGMNASERAFISGFIKKIITLNRTGS